MSRIRVELLTSHSTNWQNVSNYATTEWGGEGLHGGGGVFPSLAGSLVLRVVDKRTDKDTHHWVDLVLTSTTRPRCRFAIVQGDSEPPVYKTIFDGFVDQNSATYEGDVVTGFSVVSLMEHLDSVDVSPAANGEPAITTYSGPVATLLDSALNKAGVTSPDIDIKHWRTGTLQSDTDWAHRKRYWDSKEVGVSEYGLGDFVPCHDAAIAIGFTLKDGHLYRVNESGALAGINNDLGAPLVTSGVRLFRFLAESGTECLLVVEGTLRPAWARVARVSPTATGISKAWAAAGNIGAMLAMTANPVAGIVTVASSLAISALIQEAGTQRGVVQTGDSFFTASAFRLFDIGDGTSGAGGVGRAISRTHTITDAAFLYTPVDSVCTSAANAVGDSPGEIIYVRWQADEGAFRLRRAFWNTGAGRWDEATMGTSSSRLAGEPTGGIACVVHDVAVGENNRTIMVGAAKGYVVYAQYGVNLWHQAFHHAAVPPGRFIGGLPAVSVGVHYALFVYGNQRKVMIRKQMATTTPPVETDVSANGEIIAAQSLPITIDGQVRLPLLLVSTGADGLPRLTATTCYADSDAYPQFSGYCARALPDGTGGDWRPPVLWDDTNIGFPCKRFTAICRRDDEHRLITDSYTSGLFAVARVHHDFNRDRMSVGQLLRECQRAFWLYVVPGSLSSVKVRSRHAWTPTILGTVDGTLDERPSEVTGTIYYDGAVAAVGGEVIAAGDRRVGRNVLNLSGQFLSPIWARLMVGAVVTLYPRRSASKYPNGRRTFRVRARHYRTPGGAEVSPTFEDLHHALTLNLWSFGAVYGVLDSLGYQRASKLHVAELLEYYISPTTGKGDGVDWTADEPTAVAEAGTFPGALAAPAEDADDLTGPIHDWVVDAKPQAASGAALAVGRIYGWRVWLPRGLALRAYGFGLRSDGNGDHGALYLSVWTDVDGWPGERYDDSRAVAFMSPRTAGWNTQRPNVDGKTDCALADGHCWVVLALDANASIGVVQPPIDWWYGGACGKGFAFYRSIPGGFPGFPGGTIDKGDCTLTDEVPAVYLL